MATPSIQRRIDHWFPNWVPAHDRYLRTVAEHAPNALRVLHLGAGRDAFNVRAALSGTSMVAVDVDVHGLSLNAATLRVAGDAARLPFVSETFEIILCEHVFEHLEQPQAALQECARVLRTGGSLLFLTPNRFGYVALLATLTPHWFHVRYRARLSSIAATDTFPTFYRLNTFRSIRKMALRAGLTLVQRTSITGPPTYLELSDWIHRIGVALHWLLERGPETLHISLVGVLTKKALLKSN